MDLKAGEEKADPAYFLTWIVRHLQSYESGTPWSVHSLIAAYRKSHPKHLGFKTWISDGLTTKGRIWSLHELQRVAFPDVAEVQLCTCRTDRAQKRWTREQLLVFVQEKMQNLRGVVNRSESSMDATVRERIQPHLQYLLAPAPAMLG